MDDPGVRVPPFSRQGDLAGDLIEFGPPADQLADPLRGLADHELNDLGVA